MKRRMMFRGSEINNFLRVVVGERRPNGRSWFLSIQRRVFMREEPRLLPQVDVDGRFA